MEFCVECRNPLKDPKKGKICENCLKTRPSTGFKRCHYCMSDFKLSVSGDVCLKCQEMQKKYGPPLTCKICSLQSAFGSGSCCQRCSHYQKKHGAPITCQHCNQRTAFYKDEESRRKVENNILCFLCTYNYKLRRSRERPKQSKSRPSGEKSSKRESKTEPVVETTSVPVPISEAPTVPRFVGVAGLPSRASAPNLISTDSNSGDGSSFDATMTILQITEENKEARKKLEQKDIEYQAKLKEVVDLHVEVEEMRGAHQRRIDDLKAQLEAERNNFCTQMEKLRAENDELQKLAKKKKRL